MTINKYSYKFEDENMFTSVSNSPDISNIKNNYIVWGNKKGIGGADIPIHGIFSLNKKPQYYKRTDYGRNWTNSFGETINNPYKTTVFKTENYTGATNGTVVKIVDWREILYHMADDYMKNNKKNDFISRLI
jgi:hypothetical protein